MPEAFVLGDLRNAQNTRDSLKLCQSDTIVVAATALHVQTTAVHVSACANLAQSRAECFKQQYLRQSGTLTSTAVRLFESLFKPL